MAKASEEARKLWPYLLPLMQRARFGSNGNGGGGSSSVVDLESHALSSPIHTGTLSDFQAPQFLLRDGSRSLWGHLAVEPGATIDGVDIDVHAAEPDAHHARVTSLNEAILVTGFQEVGVFLGANSGLSVDSGLQIGAGQGIETLGGVTLVDVTEIINTGQAIGEDGFNRIQLLRDTNSGLTVTGLGLKIGLPANVAIDTVNHVTTTTHGHSVTASSDPTTPTPHADLLKSTPTAGLTLGSLTVKGNVDVTNGGDFTVGANIFFVDASLHSVGIDRAPDPQFALDINGPLRATEIVGKMAIQLSDVELLCHFDGGHPYETNFTGTPEGHRGQTPTALVAPVYRPGKFYKSLVLGKAGTNKCANPSFEANLTSWATQAGGSNLNVLRVTDDFHVGLASMRVMYSTLGGLVQTSVTSSGSAGVMSFSVWLRTNLPCDVTLGLYSGGATIYASQVFSITEEWARYFITAAVPLSSTIFAYIQPVTNGDHWIWVDEVQIEDSYPTWYFDGSFGNGYGWSGTHNNSQSNRIAGQITHTLYSMAAHRWSVGAWVRFPTGHNPTTDNAFLHLLGVSGTPNMMVYIAAATNDMYVQTWDTVSGYQYQGLTLNVLADTDYHIFFTYSSGTFKGYLNGDLMFSLSRTWSGTPTYVTVAGDVMIDDLVVVQTPLAAERIKAVYESDAPVFAESSVFTFRATPKGLVWADEEGLWMKDIDGLPVMGFYGGAADTKSWGGAVLGRGDILFGRLGSGSGGWFHFDRDGVDNLPFLRLGWADQSVMSFSAEGAGLAGVLTIGTAGGVYQGNGTFALPGTGLKIFNSGGIGKISGYKVNVEQWTADTDGVLKAGGGNVVLDVGGISLTAKVNTLAFENMPSPHTIRWLDGGVVVGGLSGQYVSSFGTNYLLMNAEASGGRAGAIWLQALDALGGGSIISLDSGGNISIGGSDIGIGANAKFGGVSISLQESDSWNPTIISDATISYTSRQGYWRRVGRTIHAFGTINISTKSGGTAGSAIVVTLPVATKSGQAYSGTCRAGDGTYGFIEALSGSTNAFLRKANGAVYTVGEIANGQTWQFSISYPV